MKVLNYMGAAYIIGAVSLIWLGVLTFFFLKERSYLRLLFPQDESRDIRAKLREVVEAVAQFKQENSLLAKKLDELTIEGLQHIQRVEIVRYNPYNDTGGDQSFSVILIDGKLNGLLITSLHSRSGTRIYTKIIKAGKSDLDLSKEETDLLTKALK
jgi:hypothetical protein